MPSSLPQLSPSIEPAPKQARLQNIRADSTEACDTAIVRKRPHSYNSPKTSLSSPRLLDYPLRGLYSTSILWAHGVSGVSDCGGARAESGDMGCNIGVMVRGGALSLGEVNFSGDELENGRTFAGVRTITVHSIGPQLRACPAWHLCIAVPHIQFES